MTDHTWLVDYDQEQLLYDASRATRTHSRSKNRFTTVFGVEPLVLHRCVSYIPSEVRPPISDIFYTFYFIKNYNTMDCSAMVFDTNEKDYINTTWKTTNLLYQHLPNVSECHKLLLLGGH
eukprot:TRINITY_DN5975_c0_g1_i1.p1 TRINITY_DN5975_c0_g1~~TRINITY_DN5975_c0_g1_i1.p1  ORF type:complete len:120 (+),score=14.86 TRINITY_DN5975_c0_g1_i1:349-708(+)